MAIPRPSFLILAALTLCSVTAHAETETDALARARMANESKDYASSFAIYRDLNDKGSAEGARMLGLMCPASAPLRQI
jgi:hypothetical protein